MPIIPSISISQTALAPSLIYATDTSTGSDGAITKRRIYFETNYGTFLVESGVVTTYNPWPLADVSKSFNVLSSDYALSITVEWLDVSDNVLYTFTDLYCLAQYNKNFFYYLIQQQALTPNIIQDSNYFSNMAIYWTLIIGAINAITVGADISASQGCLDKATFMQQNQAKYF